MASPYKRFHVPPREIFHTHDSRLHATERRIAEAFGFGRMKDLYRITVGDWYGRRMVTPADVDASLAIQAARGMQVIVWRTVFRDHKARWFDVRDPSLYDPARHKDYAAYIAAYRRHTEAAFAEGADPNAVAVELIREYGMEAWHWGDGLFDNGAPAHVQYAGLAPFPSESKLQAARPAICRQDRFGHPQYGVWEYRYPEARAATVQRLLEEIAAYDFSGMVLSTRTHAVPALDGEQFGYNDVIEDDLKRQTGVGFRDAAYLRHPVAQEARRRIAGESVTWLLRDLRAAWPRDKKLVIGIPRGDYWGPPYGNLFIDWRTWLAEGLVDGLMLGEVSGKALYDSAIERGQYRNYLCDDEAGIGLNPYFYDLEHVYAPACRAAGAEWVVCPDSASMMQACWGATRIPKLERGQQPD